jgi:hypothetical protein
MSARLNKLSGVLPPDLLIKIHGKKPTLFIEQQQVDSDSDHAAEMIVQRLVGKRRKRRASLYRFVSRPFGT